MRTMAILPAGATCHPVVQAQSAQSAPLAGRWIRGAARGTVSRVRDGIRFSPVLHRDSFNPSPCPEELRARQKFEGIVMAGLTGQLDEHLQVWTNIEIFWQEPYFKLPGIHQY